MVVAIPKLKIKCGPEGPLRIYETFPDSLGKHSTGKKRGPNELEDVQSMKKQKLLDCGFWSVQCLALLKFLIEHRVGWPFTKPVDPVKLNIPDYFSIVSKPMDLGTVRSKLLKHEYGNADEFAADVRLTFANAILYNPPGNPVHKLAKEIKQIFEVRWELLKKKIVSKSSASSKRHPAEVNCSGPGTGTAASSSKIFSLALTEPSKQNSSKMVRIKKPGQCLGVGSSVKIPAKGSAQTATCKCGSCGRIICICLKSCSSSGSEVSSLTDCQVKKSSGAQSRKSDPQSNGAQASKSDPKSNDAQAHRRKQDCQVEKSSGAQSCKSDPQSNGAQASKLDPQSNDDAFPHLRNKIAKAQSILKAKHKNVPDKNNKSCLVRLLMETEEMERTLREDKARIEAEIRAAARMRIQTELRQKRERQRLELEEMKQSLYFEENNHRKMEKDFFEVCDCSSLREIRLLFEIHTGLVLRNEEEIIEEDLEEGEII